ncbi:MAG: hypothetical protein ACI9AR_000634 [Flavobacteriaceae bacterium]|jgi:hypothetical protein
MKKYLLIISLILLIGWFVVRVVFYIQFDQNCEGYIKRAADSNSIELALRELDKALDYIEANNLTTGYTSIVYNTPDEEVSFWYENLKSTLANLKGANLEIISDLEESNLLMKIGETLLDHTNNGTQVTVPTGISIYPHNFKFLIWIIASIIASVVCIANYE